MCATASNKSFFLMKPTSFILKEKINDMDMSVIIIQQHNKSHTHTHVCTVTCETRKQFRYTSRDVAVTCYTHCMVRKYEISIMASQAYTSVLINLYCSICTAQSVLSLYCSICTAQSVLLNLYCSICTA
jgi:hypothetical protein